MTKKQTDTDRKPGDRGGLNGWQSLKCDMLEELGLKMESIAGCALHVAAEWRAAVRSQNCRHFLQKSVKHGLAVKRFAYAQYR